MTSRTENELSTDLTEDLFQHVKITRENETNDEADLVLDHCYYDGHFLGWAHQLCNTRRRTSNFTPMVDLNIKKYDIHHICLALAECEPETKIEVILSTDENYISLSVGVFIKKL